MKTQYYKPLIFEWIENNKNFGSKESLDSDKLFWLFLNNQAKSIYGITEDKTQNEYYNDSCIFEAGTFHFFWLDIMLYAEFGEGRLGITRHFVDKYVDLFSYLLMIKNLDEIFNERMAVYHQHYNEGSDIGLPFTLFMTNVCNNKKPVLYHGLPLYNLTEMSMSRVMEVRIYLKLFFESDLGESFELFLSHFNHDKTTLR